MGCAGHWLLLLCVTAVTAVTKLPQLQQLNAAAAGSLESVIPSPETSRARLERPHLARVSQEYLPISFPKAHHDITPVSNVQVQMETASEASEKPLNLWRPNDLHFVTTRSEAFEISQPHAAGGNCHVARIRALSQCPNDCSHHGYCGVSQVQRGYRYIPSTLPGVCHCSHGWTGEDCSQVHPHAPAVVIVRTGNAKSEVLSEPGDVIRITVISAENMHDVSIKMFRIGGQNATNYVVLPAGGTSPSKVWEIGYMVQEGDFGPVQFTLSYTDIDHRVGTVKHDDKIVKGSIVISNFASGALYWRVRALTISAGGYTQDFNWKVSELEMFYSANLTDPIPHTQSVILASSERASQCGFLGDCENMTSGFNTYLFVPNQVTADPDADEKIIDYPSRGHGKRAQDPDTKKYFGMGNITECTAACDSLLDCSAFSFSIIGKRQGCYLYSFLGEGASDSSYSQTTYFKVIPACPDGSLMACNGHCISDYVCHNMSRHHLLPNSTSCIESIGQDQCYPQQSVLWNCPLHDCNHHSCESCGSQSIPFGRDLYQGMADLARDPYRSHHWEAADNVAGEWLMMAFKKPTTVGSIRIRHPDFKSAPMSAMLEQSNDYINWMPVAVMEDFASPEYSTDLPTPEDIAGAKREAQIFLHEHSYEEFEEQILVDLGIADGKTAIPTITFCYYTLGAENVTNFFDYSTYDEPSPQLTSKFYLPRASSVPSLPDSMEDPFKSCTDEHDWVDSQGEPCSKYLENLWCSRDGQQGEGWDSSWGDILDFSKDGISAFDACCACGGGAVTVIDELSNSKNATVTEDDDAEVVSLIETPSTEDLMKPDRDDFGCRAKEGYSWCPYTMKCVQDYEGGDGGPCSPPKSPIVSPTMTASAFTFRDECRVPGKIAGKLTILASFNDYEDPNLTDYALYFARNDLGRQQDMVIPDPIISVPKGKSVLSVEIPEIEIPPTATHLLLLTRNQGLQMEYGLTRKIEDQLNIYGDLGSYRTGACAVWRRNGPEYQDIQGFTFSPTSNYQRGKNMTMKIYGHLQCSDFTDSNNIQIGRGTATVRWIIFQSPDGSNENGRVIPTTEEEREFASGTFTITDGKCVDHDDGVPIKGFVKRFQGGNIAVWFKLEWHAITSTKTCEELGLIVSPALNTVCGSSPGCHSKATFDEALSFCNEGGSRLCTISELNHGVSKGTGCGFDNTLVWSSDSCTTPSGEIGAFVQAGDINLATGLLAKTCVPFNSTAAVRCCADTEVVPHSEEDYALVCDDLTYEIAQGVSVERAPENDKSGEFYCPDKCPDAGDDPFMVLEYRPKSAFSGSCESDEGKACLRTWISNGCGNRPPYIYGLNCKEYKKCYLAAMEQGVCGSDLSDSNCADPSAMKCVDDWVNGGCPKDVPAQCAQYEECAIRAVMEGRCAAPEINCLDAKAVDCVDAWVKDAQCGDFPAFGDMDCADYEVCAMEAAEQGRCGQILANCEAADARSCVDEYVNLGCPDDITTVKAFPGIECDIYQHCMTIAEKSGRCEAAVPEVPVPTTPAPSTTTTEPSPSSTQTGLGGAADGVAASVQSVTQGVKTLSDGAQQSLGTLTGGAQKATGKVGAALSSSVSGVDNTLKGGVNDVSRIANSGSVGQALGDAQSSVTGAVGKLTNAIPISSAVQTGRKSSKYFLRRSVTGKSNHHVKNSFRRDQFKHTTTKKMRYTSMAIQEQAPTTASKSNPGSTLAPVVTNPSKSVQQTKVAPKVVPSTQIDWKVKNEQKRREWLARASADKQSADRKAAQGYSDHTPGPDQIPNIPAPALPHQEFPSEYPQPIPEPQDQQAQEQPVSSTPTLTSAPQPIIKNWGKENKMHREHWLEEASRLKKQLK